MKELEVYYYDKIYTRLENCLLVFNERTKQLYGENKSVNYDGFVDACEQMRKGLDEFKTLNELTVRELWDNIRITDM
ncbi:MAG TPA: hypothetical protein GX523_13390 [Desulfitobacterium dehalogenans]|uniref:Uncharacterized protein n=1 Tax=Desulfitobacterium dehalogenans TaxID=36854 RepID=A0A7C6Z5G0_9FIRM|nr:hypothetical protein [Desulfitobacterium dehalogenans]